MINGILDFILDTFDLMFWVVRVVVSLLVWIWLVIAIPVGSFLVVLAIAINPENDFVSKPSFWVLVVIGLFAWSVWSERINKWLKDQSWTVTF